MLQHLQKALGVASADKKQVKLSAEDVTAAVQAAVAELRAEFDEYKQTAESLLANADALHAQLAEEVDGLKAQLTEAQAALDAVGAEKAAAEAAAAAAKLEARKEKVVALVGTQRADALLQVTEGMDDAAFEAVVAALGVGATAEAQNPLFKEVGVDAEADTAKVVGETAEMRILKQKYGQKN